jgi:cytosine permease
MSNLANQPSSQLPGYIANATPNPITNRAPWYKNTAPTYAGIFLWFVFWDPVTSGGMGLSAGLGVALFGIVLAALVCHFLFYLVPGLLGMRTGLPLYIVGTSTFGAQGGFIMPGFLMGVLQFGWLGVNAFFSSMLIYNAFAADPISPTSAYPVAGHAILVVLWTALAAFMGLKGIQYVAKVATYLPILPLAILLILTVKTIGGVGNFDPQQIIVSQAITPLTALGVIALMLTYVVGFFATAGAAGVDFGTNSRDKQDVQMGGLMGVALATVVTAGLSLLIVAGAIGNLQAGAAGPVEVTATGLMNSIVGDRWGNIFMLMLAIAAFPPACFSSFIAANSFKTTLPKINPFVSVGVGAAVSILLAITGLAGKVIPVFVIIGASFGPICGAMLVDYLMAGKKWPGPRAGFNPAGWISWALGFLVGILPNLGVAVPAAPVAAFIVGAVVYYICSQAGLKSASLPLPAQLADTVK